MSDYHVPASVLGALGYRKRQNDIPALKELTFQRWERGETDTKPIEILIFLFIQEIVSEFTLGDKDCSRTCFQDCFINYIAYTENGWHS